MIVYISMEQLLRLHSKLIERTGGSYGIRDRGQIESALAQMEVSFEGVDLHPSLEEKAAALGFSLVMNHAFVDGNKRIALAAMMQFLLLNGLVLNGEIDAKEQLMLNAAAGRFNREEFCREVSQHIRDF